ncbi:MAG: DJ-1/PfpI family protein [Treponema sp.]|nr:DJ-1/PfpI family protein [Treponema sp.]
MKTAAVFLAPGFEEIEALSPIDYLRRAGIGVTTVAVQSSDTKDNLVVAGAHKVSVIADTTLQNYLKDCKDNLPDCVVCPGGSLGADNLAACTELLEHLEKCYSAGKLTTAICASPAVVFGKTNILKDKNWTCYPGMESCVSNYGNDAYLSKYSNQIFVTDGNVVTARGPGASEQFAMELVTILVGKETSEKIRKASQQR